MTRDEAFAHQPSPWAVNLCPEIRALLEADKNAPRKLVVLDDDPTGTQTVCDVPVITRWSLPLLQRELRTKGPCFYVLTNSRALTEVEARALMRDVASALRQAAHATGVNVTIVSRSDSTLRGHFPAETDVLQEELGPFTATLVMPYFEEGGRYTLNGRHYVVDGSKLVAAAETPFARDASFGYRSSDLADWIEEKSLGRVAARDVIKLALDDVRRGPARVAAILAQLPQGSHCVVDACDPRDARVVALATITAEQAGARFLYRTAASFVAARLGFDAVPRWQPTGAEVAGKVGGLVVVGSYVPKTTAQLEALRREPGLHSVELDVSRLLAQGTQSAHEIATAITDITGALAAGRDVVLFTSRKLIVGEDAAASLAIGRTVSQSLVAVVKGLATAPRFLVAKGGITSSDIATKGLNTSRAFVLGPIIPGVPVWRLGDDSRFPNLPYVVFPGNVGATESLADVVRLLRGFSALAS